LVLNKAVEVDMFIKLVEGKIDKLQYSFSEKKLGRVTIV